MIPGVRLLKTTKWCHDIVVESTSPIFSRLMRSNHELRLVLGIPEVDDPLHRAKLEKIQDPRVEGPGWHMKQVRSHPNGVNFFNNEESSKHFDAILVSLIDPDGPDFLSAKLLLHFSATQFLPEYPADDLPTCIRDGTARFVGQRNTYDAVAMQTVVILDYVDLRGVTHSVRQTFDKKLRI